MKAVFRVTVKKGLQPGGYDLSVLNNNSLALLSRTNGQEVFRTGTVTSISHRSNVELNVGYYELVRRAGSGEKQARILFQSPNEADEFQAELFVAKYAAHNDVIDMSGERGRIKVWVGTFNMGNAPPNQDLANYLRSPVKIGADLVIFSAQESDYGQGSENDLHQIFSQVVSPDYTVLFKRSLGQVRLYVAFSKRLDGFVSDLFASEEATGILNLVKNKGAAVASFTIFGSPIAVVSSHLNAHQKNVERRNEDYKLIITDVDVSLGTKDIMSTFHHIIWAGDLNYRIDLPYEEVEENIAKENFDYLIQYDQLQRQIKLGNAFQGFSEGRITFPPTYKFKKNTTMYDKESTRIPAWCDRILVRSFDGLDKTCIQYTSHPEVMSSDHRPVSALWSLDVVLPRPPPPPFASFIGMRSFIEFRNLSIQTGKQLQKASVIFESPFLAAPAQTATGKGKSTIDFPDECVPLLIPEVFFSPEYLLTLFITATVQFNDSVGFSVIPLHFVISDIFRPFSYPISHKLQQLGTLKGEIRMVSASDTLIKEQKLRHQKAGPEFSFETRRKTL